MTSFLDAGCCLLDVSSGDQAAGEDVDAEDESPGDQHTNPDVTGLAVQVRADTGSGRHGDGEGPAEGNGVPLVLREHAGAIAKQTDAAELNQNHKGQGAGGEEHAQEDGLDGVKSLVAGVLHSSGGGNIDVKHEVNGDHHDHVAEDVGVALGVHLDDLAEGGEELIVQAGGGRHDAEPGVGNEGDDQGDENSGADD